VRSGAKTAAVVNAVSALRAKLGGGAESPITGPGGTSGIVRALTIPVLHVSTLKHMGRLPLPRAGLVRSWGREREHEALFARAKHPECPRCWRHHAQIRAVVHMRDGRSLSLQP